MPVDEGNTADVDIVDAVIVRGSVVGWWMNVGSDSLIPKAEARETPRVIGQDRVPKLTSAMRP